MPINKLLAQKAPAAATVTTLYTVPVSAYSTIYSILICNRDSGSSIYRIAVALTDTGILNENYIYWNQTIPANSTVELNIPDMRLFETYTVYVYSDTGNVSFTLLGY